MRANLVEQKSKVAMVNQAINLLNPDDAEIITLFYKSEQSLEEIAQILDWKQIRQKSFTPGKSKTEG
ncbi:MAG: hypothetical protein WDO16_23300 [Bacteroidota bacterium]